jgi:hypothetical protein
MLLARLAARVSAGDPNSAEISDVTSRSGAAIAAVSHNSWQSLDADDREATGVGSEVLAR